MVLVSVSHPHPILCLKHRLATAQRQLLRRAAKVWSFLASVSVRTIHYSTITLEEEKY
jgi:hypothetical protein